MRGNIGHKMEVNHKLHAPAPLSPGTDPHPLKIRLERFLSRFGRVVKKEIKLYLCQESNYVIQPTVFSLYSLSYPGLPQNKRRELRLYRNYVSACSLGMRPYWLQFGWKLQKHPIAGYFERDTNWEEYGKKLVWPLFSYIQELACKKCESQRTSSIKDSLCSVYIRTTEI